MTVEVQLDDLHSAFMVWVNFHTFTDMPEARRTFAHFLDGAPLPVTLGFLGRWELTHEQARRMHLLLSPHWYTVIKAYYAKKTGDMELLTKEVRNEG